MLVAFCVGKHSHGAFLRQPLSLYPMEGSDPGRQVTTTPFWLVRQGWDFRQHFGPCRWVEMGSRHDKVINDLGKLSTLQFWRRCALYLVSVFTYNTNRYSLSSHQTLKSSKFFTTACVCISAKVGTGRVTEFAKDLLRDLTCRECKSLMKNVAQQ